MGDFFPVAVEVEVRAVVEVVAGVADVVACLLLCDLHQFFRRFFFARFDELDVAAAGSVAVLTLISEQMLRGHLVQITGLVAKHFLRVPARDVTGQALGIENPRDVAATFLDTCKGFGVACGFPLREGFFVAFAALLRSNERVARGVLDGRFRLGQFEIFQKSLVVLHVLDHFRRIGKTITIEFDEIRFEWRIGIRVPADDGDVFPFVAAQDESGFADRFSIRRHGILNRSCAQHEVKFGKLLCQAA